MVLLHAVDAQRRLRTAKRVGGRAQHARLSVFVSYEPSDFIGVGALGAPLVLVPMLVADSLGLKRFGSIGGITGVCNTIGAAVGSVGGGKIYDLSGSYVPAFEVFVVMCLLGAAVTYSCRSFESEQARQASQPVPATA